MTLLTLIKKKISLSDDLLEMLKENNIGLEKELIINDDETIKLFKKNFISKKFFFGSPELQDCIDRHEIVSGEINYK